MTPKIGNLYEVVNDKGQTPTYTIAGIRPSEPMLYLGCVVGHTSSRLVRLKFLYRNKVAEVVLSISNMNQAEKWLKEIKP